MGFIVTIEGDSTINLSMKTVTSVDFIAAVPEDSNARSSSLGASMIIKGRILENEIDSEESLKVSEWSRVPTTSAKCYRKVTVQVIADNTLKTRQYVFSKAFIVDYTEDFSEEEGTGTFTLFVRQKKDNITDLEITGGFK